MFCCIGLLFCTFAIFGLWWDLWSNIVDNEPQWHRGLAAPAILLKSLQILPSFPEMTSVLEVTFCFHVLLLEKERTRANIELPTPVFQPPPQKYLVPFHIYFHYSNFYIWLAGFELPHWQEQSLKKRDLLSVVVQLFFWSLFDFDCLL